MSRPVTAHVPPRRLRGGSRGWAGAPGLTLCPGQGKWGCTPKRVYRQGESQPLGKGLLWALLSCCSQGLHLAF